jgi:hypothetical protein
MKAFSIANSQVGANYTSCSLLTKNSSLQICGTIPLCSSPFRYTSAVFLIDDSKRDSDSGDDRIARSTRITMAWLAG